MSMSYQAGGTILPCRFVAMPDTGGAANDYIVVQASVSTTPSVVGVSAPWDRFAPGTPFDTGTPPGPGPVATIGEEVLVNSDPEICKVETGAAVQGGDL